MIVYKKGDVLKAGERVIVHGCNCMNTMGAGIAQQIREYCSSAYWADMATTRGDITKLGTYTVGMTVVNGELTYILNAYTQFRYGREKRHADYNAIVDVFELICQDFPHKVFAMPKIGTGLAGGDWNIIEAILTAISDKHGKTFHVYELDRGQS